MSIKPEDIALMTYDEAVSALIVNPHTTYAFRQRMREDGTRNLSEALRDAELLVPRRSFGTFLVADLNDELSAKRVALLTKTMSATRSNARASA